MDRRKNKDNDKLPSSGQPSKFLTFKIEIKTLVEVIILILITLMLIGCVAKEPTKQVYCRDSFQSASGWVSAESTSSYWVVNDDGKLMEFNKQKCSIKG